jgi:hypothetical protein
VISHSDPQEGYFTVDPQERVRVAILGSLQVSTNQVSRTVRRPVSTSRSPQSIDFVSPTYWKYLCERRSTRKTPIIKPSLHTFKRPYLSHFVSDFVRQTYWKSEHCTSRDRTTVHQAVSQELELHLKFY